MGGVGVSELGPTNVQGMIVMRKHSKTNTNITERRSKHAIAGVEYTWNGAIGCMVRHLARK